MEKYVWLFPVLFIFHDMEELIGFNVWIKKNKAMMDMRFPKISSLYDDFSTEGMALAVFEEFVLCIIVCLTAMISGCYALWLGGFIAYAIHLAIHIIQSIIIGKYIPALATSIIALPISVWLIWNCIKIMNYSAVYTILFGMMGLVIVVVNIKFSHKLMRRYTHWLHNNL